MTALCADFNGTTSLLLSAGRKIKLWDSVKRELLKVVYLFIYLFMTIDCDLMI